jgi:hypothetical protein
MSLVWEWVVIVCLYAFATLFLRLLGGVGAAEDALRRWGRASSTLPPGRGPSR